MTESFRERVGVEIKREEGMRLRPYSCSAGKTTIGWGRNLTDVGVSTDEALLMFNNDLDRAIRLAEASFLYWQAFTEGRQRAFVNLAFNIGYKIKRFEKMIAAADKGKWDKAADELMDSLYATQVPERAKRLEKMIREG